MVLFLVKEKLNQNEKEKNKQFRKILVQWVENAVDVLLGFLPDQTH
jgi:hypothetical protein